MVLNLRETLQRILICFLVICNVAEAVVIQIVRSVCDFVHGVVNVCMVVIYLFVFGVVVLLSWSVEICRFLLH
uniref:Uncharacterized protein n=1 Tax=Anopheles gambiae TaxID=7165 RepID=A0ABK8G7N5_ANOGA